MDTDGGVVSDACGGFWGGYQERLGGSNNNNINTAWIPVCLVYIFCEERPHGSSSKEEINSYSSRDAHEKVESTTQRDVNSPFSLKRTAKLVADSVMACVTV